MAVKTFPLPVPQFIQRKLDRGRTKLDACAPLVLLRRRLAEADTGCAPPPSSDDRLSLPMLLERHGRWSTALMCGAVEEVAIGLLVYQNGPVPVCDQSLPKARIAAQKVVLTACNLLLSTSTELVDRGVDAVQCVKENSVVLTKMSPTMPHSLPGVAVIRSLDATFSNKDKVNAAVRAFLDSRVNARVLRAHACFFDAAEDLVRWHKILRVPHPRSQDQLQLQLRSVLCAMPGRAKLAVQRTWTAASVWALCAALSHASAANMVLAIVMGSDDFMDEEESVEEEKAEDGAPALVHEVREPTKLDTDGSTISTGKPKTAIGTQEDANNEAAGAQSENKAIKNALSKLRARPASFITSQGNKYRVKTQTREDDLASTRRRVVVKASLQGKGSKAKEAVLGIRVRVPAERLREGARVVVSKEKGKAATRDAVEATKISEVVVPMEGEVPATQSIKQKDSCAEAHERVQSTRRDGEATPGAKKKSLRRGAAETIGRLSWRLMSRAATILPEAVVAAGSAAIVKGSSALGLDDALGLQTYYKWEEGPAVIGPWGSQGRWTLVADNCPPPSPPPPPATTSDASAYAYGGGASGSSDIEDSNAVDTEGDASGSEAGAVKDKEKTSNNAEVSTEGVEKPVVGGSKVSADSIPKASVEPPAKVETTCSGAKGSKEVNPNEDNESRRKIGAQTLLRLPLDRYPRPRLSWFALQAGLQSVRDVIKSVRGQGVDLWQDGAAGVETKCAGPEEEGTHSLESDKPESTSPANGVQEGVEPSFQVGEKDDALRPLADTKENQATQGALDDHDNISHYATSDEQAVQDELLESEKEESASDHGDASEEFTLSSSIHVFCHSCPNHVEQPAQRENTMTATSPCVPGGWVTTVNHCNTSDLAEGAGGSEMSRNCSNSSDATLVNTDAGGDRKGKTVNSGEQTQSDGGLMSWLLSTRIVDLGESIVSTSKVSKARAKGSRRHISEAHFDSTTPMLCEDGYMAQSESFADFLDHKKSGGPAESESFGEFVVGVA